MQCSSAELIARPHGPFGASVCERRRHEGCGQQRQEGEVSKSFVGWPVKGEGFAVKDRFGAAVFSLSIPRNGQGNQTRFADFAM